jgi:hypothetical protein
MVEAQVQSRAGTEFEQPQGHLAPACHQQEAAEQCGRAPHLVGLDRQLDQGSQRLDMLRKRAAKHRPHLARRRAAAARRGVASGQLGSAPLQHQAMDCAHEAQAQPQAVGIVLVSGQNVPGGAAGFDILGGAGQEFGIERRTQLGGPAGLRAQAAGHDRFGTRDRIHEARRLLPPPACRPLRGSGSTRANWIFFCTGSMRSTRTRTRSPML